MTGFSAQTNKGPTAPVRVFCDPAVPCSDDTADRVTFGHLGVDAHSPGGQAAVLAAIGRVITSSWDIQGLYEPLFRYVQHIIPHDRIGISRFSPDEGQLVVFANGIEVREWSDGRAQFEGSIEQIVSKTGSAVLAAAETREQVEDCLPGELPAFEAGIRSWLAAPLISHGGINGFLVLSSRDGEAYAAHHVDLVKSVSAQIAGAIANALLIEQLKKSRDDLAAANRELEQFASVASHDLQEPLRKIQAFGDRLKAESAHSLSDRGREHLERMQAAAQRGTTLIGDLLKVSRVTTRAEPFTQISLADVAREAVSDLEAQIRRESGHVDIGELPSIEADPTQMRQLLQNLISNALKFHVEGEPPLVRVRGRLLSDGQKEGSTDSGEQLCQITVEDNGIGFAEEYSERIFTIFQRLNGRSAYEGTGIGLAVCRKIAERHRGTVTAASTPGHGARFTVTLPTAQPPHEGIQ